MPSSQFSYIPEVLDLITRSPHLSILDVGPGFGKYGVLCREYCDLIPAWFEKKLSGFDQKNWQITIDCAEAHKEYITPLHKYIYDNIILGKIEDLVDSLDKYDLVLFIGTLEHLEKGKGIEVLNKFFEKAKAIIVVTPNGYKSQKIEWNNPFEEHLSGWIIQDFDSLGFKYLILPENKIIAYWKK